MFELLVLTQGPIELVSHIDDPRIVFDGLRGTPDGSRRPDQHDPVPNDEQPQEDARGEVERAQLECFFSKRSQSKASHRSLPSTNLRRAVAIPRFSIRPGAADDRQTRYSSLLVPAVSGSGGVAFRL